MSPSVDEAALRACGRALGRLGDADGAAETFLRLGAPREAVRLCVGLKRFDKALAIAQEHGIVGEVDEHMGEYLR